MDAWLGQLVGRFDLLASPPKAAEEDTCALYSDNVPGARCVDRIQRMILIPEYVGVAECRSVDATHGIHCLLSWRGYQFPYGAVLPTMLLVGIDPDDLAIRFLQVNHEGLATLARGQLKGKVANLTEECAGRDCLPMTWSISQRSGERPVEILIHAIARMKAAERTSVNADLSMILSRAGKPD